MHAMLSVEQPAAAPRVQGLFIQRGAPGAGQV